MIPNWLLCLLPLSILFVTSPAFGQQRSLLMNGDVKTVNTPTSNVNGATADTLSSVPADSSLSGLNGAWYSRPGQMPVFIPDSTLTDAMPVLTPPRVDEDMIIPIAAKRDTSRVVE